jgi:hypothetical protein
MYYQYGYFKPLVARKVGGVLTVRQVVPSGALLMGVAFLTATPWHLAARVTAIVLFGVYLASILGVALHRGSARDWRTALAMVVTFPVIHVSYAVGFLKGVLDFVVRRRRSVRPALSR